MRCKVNGIEIHYTRTGGDKPPIVLLHGLITSGACWAPVARQLREQFDVIMPDARGHGQSSAPKTGYTYSNLADDVMGLVEALDLQAPVLLGHSMGGLTAALAASRKPRLFSSLVLVDPTFLTPERQQEVYASDVAAQHRAILSGRSLPKRRTDRSPELVELLSKARLQTSIDAFEILTPPNPNYMELIPELPTLLVIGGEGGVVSPLMAQELATLNPHLEIAQIPEAGHGIPFDQPERLAALVQKFSK